MKAAPNTATLELQIDVLAKGLTNMTRRVQSLEQELRDLKLKVDRPRDYDSSWTRSIRVPND